MGCVTSKTDKKQKDAPSQWERISIPSNKAQSQKIKFPELKLYQLSPSFSNFNSRTIQLEKNIIRLSYEEWKMECGNLDNNIRNKSQSVEASD